MQHKNYTKGIAAEIKKELKAANNSIIVSVPWFTDSSIFSILKEKAKGGVTIKVLIQDDDINKGADFNIKDLANYNAEIFWNTSKFRLSHRKFCIIDSNIVIKGSYNWTNKARSNEEEIDIFHSRELAIESLKTFEESIKKYDVKKYDKQEILEAEKREKLRLKHECKISKFKERGKIGFKNELGDVIIPAIYDDATDFNWHNVKAYVFVRRDFRWGLLDNYNNEVVLEQYKESFAFTDFRFAFSYSYTFWGERIETINYYYIKHRNKIGLMWHGSGLPSFLFPIQYDSIRPFLQNGRCFIFHRKEKHQNYKISYLVNNKMSVYPPIDLWNTNYEFKSIEPLSIKYHNEYYFKISVPYKNSELWGLLKAQEYNENDYPQAKTIFDKQLQFSIQIKPMYAGLTLMTDINKHPFLEAKEYSHQSHMLRTVKLNIYGERLHMHMDKESRGNSELLTQREIDWRKTKEERDSTSNLITIIFIVVIVIIFVIIFSS